MSIKLIWSYFLSCFYWRFRLGNLGRRSILFKPLMVFGAKHIYIGSGTRIREFARLEAITRQEMGWETALRIGDNVNIEQGVHIVCQCDVVIEDNVSITPYCTIVDTYHPHDPPDIGPKIGMRLPTKRSYVHVGAGAFIGTKAVILPNVRIGKCAVIGAGAVVTRDVPDFAVAIGSPARVISQFDLESRQWVRVVDDQTDGSAHT